jgi:ketosteroid isomerase-like protein
MASYEEIRRQYQPDQIEWLFVAESPPPSAGVNSSRHFYRADYHGPEDRLFANTIRGLYEEAYSLPEPEITKDKETWLRRLQADGVYMIEALEESERHKVTKKERQEHIRAALPRLIERVRELAGPKTKIILIKSNPFEIAAEPLREAGFTVLNEKLVDYPGIYNLQAHKDKVRALLQANGWKN